MGRFNNSPRQLGVRGLLVLGTLVVVGCAREAEPVFVYQGEIQNVADHSETAMDAKHQQQIKEILTRHFGTPSNPWFRVTPTGAAAAHSEAVKEDQAVGASAAQKLEDWIAPDRLKQGADVYAKQCQSCHGVTGDGNGPAAQYLVPLPRDYRKGKFKFASGPRETKPRREDLMRIVRRGAKGTAMPSFRWMSDEDMGPLLDYVMMLSCRGELELRLIRVYKEDELDLDEKTNEKVPYQQKDVDSYLAKIVDSWNGDNHPAVLPAVAMTPDTPENRELGAKLFIQMSCYSCHGRDARGAPIGKNDDWGHPARSANLAAGMLHGGRRQIDIYRRLANGVTGTPMPSSEQATDPGETREMRSQKLWNMVHFITSVIEGQDIPPALREEMERLANELEAKAGKKAEAAKEDAAAPKTEAPEAK